MVAWAAVPFSLRFLLPSGPSVLVGRFQFVFWIHIRTETVVTCFVFGPRCPKKTSVRGRDEEVAGRVSQNSLYVSRAVIGSAFGCPVRQVVGAVGGRPVGILGPRPGGCHHGGKVRHLLAGTSSKAEAANRTTVETTGRTGRCRPVCSPFPVEAGGIRVFPRQLGDNSGLLRWCDYPGLS